MGVKSEFLNGVISEGVYVKQPPGFDDSVHSDYVFKLKKNTLWTQTSSQSLVLETE